MCKCAIVGEQTLISLIVRYNGIGKPLTNDEREILLFALYNDSEALHGIAERGAIETAKRADAARVIKGGAAHE